LENFNELSSFFLEPLSKPRTRGRIYHLTEAKLEVRAAISGTMMVSKPNRWSLHYKPYPSRLDHATLERGSAR
jgi:hypothetical protein